MHIWYKNKIFQFVQELFNNNKRCANKPSCNLHNYFTVNIMNMDF